MTPAPINASAPLLASLQAWAEAGWLRRLDSAFARFLAGCDPTAPPALLLASALLAHLEGRGHSCLRLDSLLQDADALLAWPTAGSTALQAQLAGLPSAPADWLALLQASPLVALEGQVQGQGASAPAGTTPLVLCGNSLYLRRYRAYERQIATQVLQRARNVQVVDTALARSWLDRLFPPAAGPAAADQPGPDPTNPAPGVDWQKAACALALRGGLTIITGGPGTGKTHTAARLLALRWAMHPTPTLLRVGLAAPTGKAAARLQQSISAALQGLAPALDAGLPPGTGLASGTGLALRDLASHIGPARTLHRLLGASPETRRLRADAAHPLALDLLIVDEASMVHLEMMAALLDALPPQASLVLLGDKDQLASVEAGAVLGDLCHRAAEGRYRPDTAQWLASTTGSVLPAALLGTGPALAQHTVMLRRSHRFGGPIGALAQAVNTGDAATAAALLAGPPGQHGQAVMAVDASNPAALLRLALHGRPGAEGGYSRYLQLLRQGPPVPGLSAELSDIGPLGPADAIANPTANPTADQTAAHVIAHTTWARSVLQAFDTFRLLCAVRDGAWGSIGLNQAVERALADQGLIQRRGEWYPGRPVMVTRNDPGLGVFNGDIGIVLPPATPGAPLRAYFLHGDALRSVSVARLVAVDTAFAMTVHKSQGSEFGHTVLVLPPEPGRGLSREGVYTGITRARQAFTLASGRPGALAEALARPTRRASGLLALLGDGGGAAHGSPATPSP